MAMETTPMPTTIAGAPDLVGINPEAQQDVVVESIPAGGDDNVRLNVGWDTTLPYVSESLFERNVSTGVANEPLVRTADAVPVVDDLAYFPEMFSMTLSATATTVAAGGYAAGSYLLDVVSTAGFAAGDFIEVESPPGTFLHAIVKSVTSPTQLELWTVLRDDSTELGAAAGDPVTVMTLVALTRSTVAAPGPFTDGDWQVDPATGVFYLRNTGGGPTPVGTVVMSFYRQTGGYAGFQVWGCLMSHGSQPTYDEVSTSADCVVLGTFPTPIMSGDVYPLPVFPNPNPPRGVDYYIYKFPFDASGNFWRSGKGTHVMLPADRIATGVFSAARLGNDSVQLNWTNPATPQDGLDIARSDGFFYDPTMAARLNTAQGSIPPATVVEVDGPTGVGVWRRTGVAVPFPLSANPYSYGIWPTKMTTGVPGVIQEQLQQLADPVQAAQTTIISASNIP